MQLTEKRGTRRAEEGRRDYMEMIAFLSKSDACPDRKLTEKVDTGGLISHSGKFRQYFCVRQEGFPL